MKRELLLILFIGIPSLAGLWGFSSWPFSSFAMYSRPHQPIIRYVLIAHEVDGSSWQVSRLEDMRPLGSIWLSLRIQDILQQQHHETKLHRVMKYYCQKFNYLRAGKRSPISHMTIQDITQGQNLEIGSYDCQ